MSAVQEYLEKFGYLGQKPALDEPFELNEIRPSGNPLFEDDRPASRDGEFDEATEAALREFQRFVGLEPTGEVDDATFDVLNTKRCGLADVAEFSTGAGKWSSTNLTYSFQNFTNDIDDAAIGWAIDHAFAMWSAETPLRFRRVANGTSGDIVIRFVTGDHGDGAPFDGAGSVLAHAFYPSNSGAIKGDSHFDDAETWTVNVPTGAGIDLVTVAAHEFGHALGLRHSADPTALMAPTYPGPRRFLSPDDIAGITSLYGGVGSIEHASWIHGNAALIEHPDRVESQRYYGFFNRIVGKPNTTNWIHFAIPTPVIEDGNRLAADRFMLRAVTGGPNALLRDVHIRDGSDVISYQNRVDRSGTLAFERFGVASVPDVRWGLSVSLGFTFGGGSANARRVDLISAGFDFKP